MAWFADGGAAGSMVGVLQCANSKAARLSLLSARELLRSDSEVRGGGSILSYLIRVHSKGSLTQSLRGHDQGS